MRFNIIYVIYLVRMLGYHCSSQSFGSQRWGTVRRFVGARLCVICSCLRTADVPQVARGATANATAAATAEVPNGVLRLPANLRRVEPPSPSLMIADAERLVLSLIEDSKECEANLAYVRSVYPMQKSNSISFLSKRIRV